jgi:hypothetical protein
MDRTASSPSAGGPALGRADRAGFGGGIGMGAQVE